jgi:DNA-binding MarR family transcriptional regulator
MLPIIKNISIIERCNLLFRNEAFKKFDLSGYQYSYLIEICRNPGISQEQLTKNMHIDKSNVARGLTSLVEKDYIFRQNNPNDNRYILLYPTDKAMDIYGELREIIKRERAFLMEEFSVQEEEQLVALLEKLKDRALLLKEWGENL